MIEQPTTLGMKLLVYLGSKEAPKGYNTVYGNNMKSMPKPLTSMTFDEVVADGQRRTRQYGSSACGRFQFMRDTLDKPGTLADLKGELKLSGSELFNKTLQDGLGWHLLKRRGFLKFIAGKITVNAFAIQLAKEWASFPVFASMKGVKKQIKRGDSYYQGDGKNKPLFNTDEAERFLRGLLAEAGAPQAAPSAALDTAEAPIIAQAAGNAPVPPSRPSIGGFLASWFGKLTPGAGIPGDSAELPKGFKGDPALGRVQLQLKNRNYYAAGRVDGFDGDLTQEAVAQIRKDNGLKDGGIDAEFLSKLPTWGPRPVSAARKNATAGQALTIAQETAPDLTQGVSRMWKLGAGILTLGGADAAQTSGLLKRAQEISDQGSEVLNTVQTTTATIASAISWAVEHRGLIYIGLGLLALMWAGNMALKIIIRVRTAFGI